MFSNLSKALEVLFHQVNKVVPTKRNCVDPTGVYSSTSSAGNEEGFETPLYSILQDLQVVSFVEMPEGVVAALMT